jgi:hypothetical protein
MNKKLLIIASFALASLNSCQNDDVDGLDINSKPIATTETGKITVTEGETGMIPFGISSSSSKPFTVQVQVLNEGIVNVNDLEYIAGNGISDDSRSFEYDVPAYSNEFELPIEALTDIIAEETELVTLRISTSGTRAVVIEGGYKDIVLEIIDDGLACPWSIDDFASAMWSGTNTPESGPASASVASVSYDGTDFFVSGLPHSWVEDPAYWSETIIASAPVMMSLNQSTGVVTIEEQFTCTATYLGAVQDDYSVQATGLFDPCTSSITFNYDLIQDESILDSGVEVITMN